ncbi:hypothetical protein EYF80_029951 [Liparis tanakae]|uniref:Uncharacterized protein n=1 Tax=Liparis tanakae TaxID=230148 RepID=A0A4Z2H3G6_9TELE|nr:hypothetical protein EYF80_029951 [Liparis tanakae]
MRIHSAAAATIPTTIPVVLLDSRMTSDVPGKLLGPAPVDRINESHGLDVSNAALKGSFHNGPRRGWDDGYGLSLGVNAAAWWVYGVPFFAICQHWAPDKQSHYEPVQPELNHVLRRPDTTSYQCRVLKQECPTASSRGVVCLTRLLDAVVVVISMMDVDVSERLAVVLDCGVIEEGESPTSRTLPWTLIKAGRLQSRGIAHRARARHVLSATYYKGGVSARPADIVGANEDTAVPDLIQTSILIPAHARIEHPKSPRPEELSTLTRTASFRCVLKPMASRSALVLGRSFGGHPMPEGLRQEEMEGAMRKYVTKTRHITQLTPRCPPHAQSGLFSLHAIHSLATTGTTENTAGANGRPLCPLGWTLQTSQWAGSMGG